MSGETPRATSSVADARPAPAAQSPRGRTQRRRLLVVGLVLAAVAGFLIDKALTSATVYFKTASEAVAARGALGGATFDIEGTVVCGTVHGKGSGIDRFTIASGAVRVAVQNSGVPPELFEAGVPVVLVGHFVGSSDVFSSDSILVKHSNSYVAAHPGRLKATTAASCFRGQT